MGKKARDGKILLRDISLDLFPNEVVALTGPSGAGKSTLLNIAGLLDSPSTGSVFVNGQLVGSRSKSAKTRIRRNEIGFLFQAIHLVLSRTTGENVMMGMLHMGITSAERRARALGALRRVGLVDRFEQLAIHLSGGERQRVALARSIAFEPLLLLCDEPTGSLDRRTGQHILELLNEASTGGASVLLVTHDEEVADGATRRISIESGQLVGADVERDRT
ncbi:ABC transporter ATP-binding protein [Glutamicibacter halophytocola]|uniref:ABC transporter ATP-binding protein n=1 Tax=Glutamicibacter halophytocola TaxID=1933880 RepID=UPI0035632602